MPSGKPGSRKFRSLSKLLERIGGEPMVVKLESGELGEVIPEEYLAKMIWAAVMNKQMVFNVDGEMVKVPIGMSDWLDMTKFIYKQIDGNAPSNVDHSGTITHEFSVNEWKAKRLERLSAIKELPDVDNTFTDNVIVDIKARDSDNETVSKYDDKVMVVSEDD